MTLENTECISGCSMWGENRDRENGFTENVEMWIMIERAVEVFHIDGEIYRVSTV